MSVLVTGGAGYIGSHAALALLEHGERVIVLDNLSTGKRGLVPPEARFVEGDYGDRKLVSALLEDEGVDSILHFGGSIIVSESMAEPLAYYDNNTCKATSLLQASVEAGIKAFIFSSSAAVYGATSQELISEQSVLDPINPYGRSKLMTEWMLEDANRAYGLPYISLRYFNVAGADPQGRTGESPPEATHLVKVACQVATGKRDQLQIYGTDYPTPDGTCVRDYIHVTDLANAHVAALDALRANGKSAVYNCGYGRGYSVLEVISALEEVLGKPVPSAKAQRRPGDPPSLVAEANAIRQALDWQPKYDDIAFIVRTALEWERHLN